MAATSSDLSDPDEGSRVARLAEQRRIARILHDSLSQSLTAAYFQAVVLTQKMDKDGSAHAGDAGRLADMLHEVVAELREVTRHLSPEAVDGEVG